MYVTANFELFKRWRALLSKLQVVSAIVHNSYELEPSKLLQWQKDVDSLLAEVQKLKIETIAHIKGVEISEVELVEKQKNTLPINDEGLVLPTRIKRVTK